MTIATPPSGPELLSALAERSSRLSRDDDSALQQQVATLHRRARSEGLDGRLLIDLFALTRELADRELGERPYDVQMLAGLELFRGRMVEMQTGEGKTLAAVAPVALAALAGLGVHVLTFNDYLARRDAEWMGPVYRRLGLTAGSVGDRSTAPERRRAYRCDVTYLTVQEAGFDLLRDSLQLDPGAQVHRPFHRALVDEADSILIDEARVPLVIAGALDEAAVDLGRLAELARRLEPERDWDTDEHRRNVFLTDEGLARAEAELGRSDLYATRDERLLAEIRNALHAEALLSRDVDYIVRQGRVELVDEHTGRVADRRQWPDGLQAAVEAKEGLSVRPEGRVLGSITVQHLIRLYPELCGMTATATPAATELSETYGLEISPIPTHRPCGRRDDPDLVFASQRAKRRAVIEEITKVHATGRPILVGTASVEASEALATELEGAGIGCRVLNARNDAEEAAIVAEAGAFGAVTISTNMAGRGTDIRLGGADGSDRERIADLGGLYLLGTQRHESRRIDDQLRGRAGRQGDPGSSRFFLSLEDPVLERFGIERLIPSAVYPKHSDLPVDHPVIRREVDRAQRIAEGESGDIRSRLMRYAELLEHQRRSLGEWRQAILEGREDADLLADRCPDRWRELTALCGEPALREIEHRLTLLATDRVWSEHVEEAGRLRDEIHLVQLDGRDPLTEFYRATSAAFGELAERIEATAAEGFESLPITADGADWEAAGLRAPSSTWTYLVHDNALGGGGLHTLATRASLGFAAVIAAWPILLVWGLVEHWRRWKKARAAARSAVADRVRGSS